MPHISESRVCVLSIWNSGFGGAVTTDEVCGVSQMKHAQMKQEKKNQFSTFGRSRTQNDSIQTGCEKVARDGIAIKSIQTIAPVAVNQNINYLCSPRHAGTMSVAVLCCSHSIPLDCFSMMACDL